MQKHLDGITGVATATEMQVTKVTVHWLIKRARRRIAAYFAERDVQLPGPWAAAIEPQSATRSPARARKRSGKERRSKIRRN
jgi:hypothetical protein